MPDAHARSYTLSTKISDTVPELVTTIRGAIKNGRSMPIEYREITFTKAEVAEALKTHASVATPDAPALRPNGISVADNEQAMVTLRQTDDEPRSFSAIEVTAALIRLAGELGVPIARRSRKAVELSPGGICLKLWLD